MFQEIFDFLFNFFNGLGDLEVYFLISVCFTTFPLLILVLFQFGLKRHIVHFYFYNFWLWPGWRSALGVYRETLWSAAVAWDALPASARCVYCNVWSALICLLVLLEWSVRWVLWSVESPNCIVLELISPFRFHNNCFMHFDGYFCIFAVVNYSFWVDPLINVYWLVFAYIYNLKSVSNIRICILACFWFPFGVQICNTTPLYSLLSCVWQSPGAPLLFCSFLFPGMCHTG